MEKSLDENQIRAWIDRNAPLSDKAPRCGAATKLNRFEFAEWLEKRGFFRAQVKQNPIINEKKNITELRDLKLYSIAWSMKPGKPERPGR